MTSPTKHAAAVDVEEQISSALTRAGIIIGWHDAKNALIAVVKPLLDSIALAEATNDRYHEFQMTIADVLGLPTGKDDGVAILIALGEMKKAKEAAETELAKMREFITASIRDRNADGKTIVDFQAVWLDQARKINGELKEQLAASEKSAGEYRKALEAAEAELFEWKTKHAEECGATYAAEIKLEKAQKVVDLLAIYMTAKNLDEDWRNVRAALREATAQDSTHCTGHVDYERKALADPQHGGLSCAICKKPIHYGMAYLAEDDGRITKCEPCALAETQEADKP